MKPFTFQEFTRKKDSWSSLWFPIWIIHSFPVFSMARWGNNAHSTNQSFAFSEMTRRLVIRFRRVSWQQPVGCAASAARHGKSPAQTEVSGIANRHIRIPLLRETLLARGVRSQKIRRKLVVRRAESLFRGLRTRCTIDRKSVAAYRNVNNIGK